MRSFKDFYQKDLDNVLFNINEKAEKRLVNGIEMTIIIDDDKLTEMKVKSQYADAIYNAQLLVFIRKKELGYKPAAESVITIGDREYIVAMASGDELLQLVLEAAQ